MLGTGTRYHGPMTAPRDSARDRVLDAYQALLIDGGERAATLEAVAAEAGLSKGGLLYHFASKEALAQGMLERFEHVVTEDLTAMRAAPEGALEYFIRTSVATQSALDHAMVATVRLAQGQNEDARTALQAAQAQWLDIVSDAVGDPVVARIAMLVSDGLYYNSALRPSVGMALPELDEMDAIIAALARLRAVRARDEADDA